MEYRLYSELIDARQAYGIEVFEEGKRIRLISDLGENKESIEELIKNLNELDFSVSELDYIIEDHLTYFSLAP